MWRNKISPERAKTELSGDHGKLALLSGSILVLLVLTLGQPAFAAEAVNTCIDCHSALEDRLHVAAEDFNTTIHAQNGISCASCHGGDPTSEDNAMSPKAGFKGHIDRKQIPQLCGSCHASTEIMRQYNPSLRTDQLAQYKTSVHGKRLAGGDTRVAVCTDCHGVHNIRPAKDTRSQVNPLNVADTCKRCHADREYMKPYGIPTDQYAAYNLSVHYAAMAVRGDLSAPTCSTCHGNHGAAPPGVSSVAHVCSTCHVFQAELFEASPHKSAFGKAKLPGCVTCHSNHRITAPNDDMIGGSSSVCANCHRADDAGSAVAQTIHTQLVDLGAALEKSEAKLKQALSAGMEVRQAEVDLASAKDALTKARVAVHSVSVDKVSQETKVGMQGAEKTYEFGVQALKERNTRRYGLGVSVLAILIAMVGLAAYLKAMESNGKSDE